MKEISRIDLAEVGSRIRQIRTKHNMSQSDLAEACGFSLPYVSDIERGKKCFSVDSLLRIAQTLQVSADWLLRLDIPQTQYAYDAEAADILSDCSKEEAIVLLEVMQATKQSLRKLRNTE